MVARDFRRALAAYNDARQQARLSLATVHTSPPRPRFTAVTHRGGQCFQLTAQGVHQGRPPTEARRSEIREFSRKSRGRLMQKLCSVPASKVREGALFVTLTYPKDYPGVWSVWKRQLDSYLKVVRRHWPNASGVWKLEPQKRGAPHFHIILFGIPHAAQQKLNQSWHRIVGTDDPWHLKFGHDSSPVESQHGVVAYAAKYAAKAQKLPEDWQGGVGRWWGVHNAEHLGIVPFYVPLTMAEFMALKDVCEQVLWHRRRRCPWPKPPDTLQGLWLPLSEMKAAKLLMYRHKLPGLTCGCTLCGVTSHSEG